MKPKSRWIVLIFGLFLFKFYFSENMSELVESLSMTSVPNRHILNECEENRCNLILDPTFVKGDAVIFNGKNLGTVQGSESFEYEQLPEPRDPNQIFVFFTMEPPPYFHLIKLQDYDNFFNWTMTYRRDSDVVVPYGKITKLRRKRNSEEIKYKTNIELKSKKLAIWMVSHCKTQSKREQLVRHLKRYMNIQQFGRCGEKKCGMSTTIPILKKLGDPCLNLTLNYAFYLSFENALCEDYVTEKFYRALKLGVIPVVFGAVNYTEFAPPKSFINAREFKTPAKLAKHLKAIARDAKLYNEYLKWQEEYEVELGSPYKPLICDLCKKLHAQTPNSSHKTYPSIKDWFFKENSCFD